MYVLLFGFSIGLVIVGILMAVAAFYFEPITHLWSYLFFIPFISAVGAFFFSWVAGCLGDYWVSQAAGEYGFFMGYALGGLLGGGIGYYFGQHFYKSAMELGIYDQEEIIKKHPDVAHSVSTPATPAIHPVQPVPSEFADVAPPTEPS